MSKEPILRYDITSEPFPLQASPATGNLTKVNLSLVVSNPTDSEVKLHGIIVSLPVGENATDLTPSSQGIGPVPAAHWSLDDTQKPSGEIKYPVPAANRSLDDTQKPSGEVEYIFRPDKGHERVGGEGLTFVFENVEINRQVGTAQVTVIEGSQDCKATDCPQVPFYLAKFPHGWGQVSFRADPTEVPWGEGPTLNWDGPEGANYRLEYYSPKQGVVNVPAPDAPPLASSGQYPDQGDRPLVLERTTTFTLNVSERVTNEELTAQRQVTVTVYNPSLKAHDLTVVATTTLKGTVTACAETNLQQGLTVSGNVRIGTPADEANDAATNLDVKGKGDTPNQISLQLRSGNSGNNYSSNQITFGYNETAEYRHAIKTRHWGGQRKGNAIDFYVWDGENDKENDKKKDIGSLHTMTLDGGNVGIGKTDPGAKLEVSGEGGSHVDLIVNGRIQSNNSNGGLWVGSAQTSGRFVGGDGGDSIGFWNNGDWRLKVDKAGNVHITGTVYAKNFSRFIDDHWQTLRYSTDGAGHMWEFSDDRLKRDISPIFGALDKVTRLSGVTYRWNEDALSYFTRDIEDTISAAPEATEEENRRVWDAEREKRQAQLSGTYIGLVAQEVEGVVPQLVDINQEGYKLIDYARLVPLLLEAIKEQSALLDGLRARIAALEGE